MLVRICRGVVSGRGVIPVADDLPLAAEDAIDGERQSDGESVHATARAARLISFDDEVPVVLLDREVDHTEAIDRRARDGAPERSEHAWRAHATVGRALLGW